MLGGGAGGGGGAGMAMDLSAVVEAAVVGLVLFSAAVVAVRRAASRYFVVDVKRRSDPAGLVVDAKCRGDPAGLVVDAKGFSTRCAACGVFSSKRCARCKRVRYCSRPCQTKHWEIEHRFKCSKKSKITMLGFLNPVDEDQPLPVLPPSDLNQHLGELLQCKDGADVTFHVCGESFSAHKIILAARSPVFKAKFFGGMAETSCKSVEVQDMEVAVFRAMLEFIYTDVAPELDGEQGPETAVIMAQHLLAAADRYGLNRLKLICECKLFGSISIDTVATTLALAEQHYCSLLKAKCIEFVTKSPEILEAVLATDGFAHLVASCPSVLAELLRAACGRKM